MADIANLTFRDKLCGLNHGWHVAIRQIDHIDDTCSAGGLHHFHRVSVGRGQWFLAQDMFASSQKRDRGPVVNCIGCDIRCGIKTTPSDGVLDCVKGVGNPKLCIKCVQVFGVGVDATNQSYAVHRRICGGVGISHGTSSDNQNTDHRKPSSPSECNRGPRSLIGSGAWAVGTLGASFTPTTRGAGLCAHRTALHNTLRTLTS